MKRFLLLALAAAPAYANHPLITEDTGVLGKGTWQLELHGERTRDNESGATTRGWDTSAVLGYGITEKTDLQLELPYLREVTDGDVTEGRGDAALSLKWRFFEKDGLSFVFKPDLLLPTGRDELGLGAGRVRWAANFVAAYELGSMELLGHIGYTHNRNRIGERDSLRHASVAARWSATDKVKLIVDIGRDSNPDPAAGAAPREIVLGATYEASKDIDLGFGLKRALNDAADDRAILAGIKLRW